MNHLDSEKQTIICPAGSALSYTGNTCITCSPGYFTSTPGRRCTSSANTASVCCSVCPEGHVCPTEGMSVPIECTPGTAANYGRTSCIKCSPGYFGATYGRQCTSSSNTASDCCRLCPTGHACPEQGTSVPTECPLGTASNFQKTQCLACPPGYHGRTAARQCTDSSNTGRYCCLPCPTGHICPDYGTINPILCPAGTAASYQSTSCVQCSPGSLTYTDARQCVSSSNTECCNGCPTGHICPGLNTTTPIKCLAGTAANYQSTDCVKCSPGYHTSSDGAKCTSSSNTVTDCCVGCPRGHICPGLATSVPIQCPAGTAANYQKTECIECPVGYTSSAGAQCSSSSNTVSVCCRVCQSGLASC